MEEGFAIWANPSSPHAEGRKAREALEDARERIKTALGWNGELIFTSGASEALWIALNRTKVDRRIVSAVEHDAVFRAAPDAEVLPVSLGSVEAPEDSSDAIVAIQQVNSETGAMFHEIDDLHDTVKSTGGLLLADCSQGAAKWAIPNCDLAVISAHKFGGPIGIGALLVADLAMLDPTGGHERGYRAGTENMPAAMGMTASLEAGGMESWLASQEDRDQFWDAMAGSWSTPGQVQSDWLRGLTHPTMSAQALLIRLDAMGFAVSAGSACSSGTLKKSRVLDAFGIDDETASRTIRVSLGWNTTSEDLDKFAEAWMSLI